MPVDVDICNRALQMIGNRNTIGALTDDSEEGQNCNLLYAAVLDWVLGVTNWNFARKTAVLTIAKTSPTPPGVWSTLYPPPPWLCEYIYPADCVRMHYVTDQSVNDVVWSGEPVRFAIATDVVSAAQTTVVLTNKLNALGIYTFRNTTVNLWPQLFAQAVVTTMAWLLSDPLGHGSLTQFLESLVDKHVTLAVTANMREGLFMEDTTPEWIAARGITYPMRRPQIVPVKPEPADANRR